MGKLVKIKEVMTIMRSLFLWVIRLNQYLRRILANLNNNQLLEILYNNNNLKNNNNSHHL